MVAVWGLEMRNELIQVKRRRGMRDFDGTMDCLWWCEFRFPRVPRWLFFGAKRGKGAWGFPRALRISASAAKRLKR